MSEASLPSSWSSIITSDGFEQISTTKKKVKTKECLATGLYPVIDQGQDKVAGYIDDHEKVIEITDPVLIFGDHTRAIKWIDKDFVPGADGTKVLKPKGFLRPRFSYYQMRALELPDKGYSRHFKFLKEIEFSIPPLNEQTRITNKLDELLAQVDTIKARVDAIPAILKRFRQSVLAAAVSGKLTEEWRVTNVDGVDVEEISIAHESFFKQKNKKYKQPEKITDATKEKLFAIPSNWTWFRAEELCDLITKGTTPKKDKMSTAGEIPYIKVYNLTFDGGLDFTIEPTFVDKSVHQNELARSKVYPGDVLMNIVGPPLGKVSVVPPTYPEWNINQAISIFRPVCGVRSVYLSICLQNSTLLEIVKLKAKATAGQFNLTLEICRDYPVPVPPDSEQNQIVQKVDQLFEFADQIEQRVKEAQARIDNLSQSFLAKAFRGELVPQDPNDEPASVLLERIKQEREEAAKLAKAAKKVGKKASKK